MNTLAKSNTNDLGWRGERNREQSEWRAAGMRLPFNNTAELNDGVPPANWKMILVPVDFSPGSEHATVVASAIADRNDGKIVFLHVISPPPYRDRSEFCFQDEAERRALDRLNRWLANNSVAPIDAKTSVRVGSSLDFAILFEAHRVRADVIVLSTKRKIRTRRLSPTNATNDILKHAPCPILSVLDLQRRPSACRRHISEDY